MGEWSYHPHAEGDSLSKARLSNAHVREPRRRTAVSCPARNAGLAGMLRADNQMGSMSTLESAA
jgi:hypothetical protein